MPTLPPSTSRRRTTATAVGLAALLLTSTAPQVARAATPPPVGAASPDLGAVAARAAAALEDYQRAAQAQTDAQTAADAARADLAAADATVQARRTELGTWASQAYRGTTGLHELSTVTALLDPRTPQDVGWTLAALDRVGGEYERAVEASETARRTQAAAAATATTALDRARATTATALAAKATAESLVQEQLVAYAAAQRGSAGLDALTPDPAVVERARERLSTTAACSGAELTGFGNGLLPLDALCPLPGAPGKVLRADAAHAFEGLSQAFEAQFGSPLPVTDAYRSLAEQVDVKARKPGLAAVPGTSRHGWGLAVDLGGGVQGADTVQHRWMDRNAALFGFVNPAWAQGSPGPFEPWHWEYVAL